MFCGASRKATACSQPAARNGSALPEQLKERRHRGLAAWYALANANGATASREQLEQRHPRGHGALARPGHLDLRRRDSRLLDYSRVRLGPAADSQADRDHGSIKNGLPGDAIIESIADTGVTVTMWGVGAYAPDYKFGLQVTPAGGGAPYSVEAKALVPRIYIPMVVPGARVGVLIDPTDPHEGLDGLQPDGRCFRGRLGRRSGRRRLRWHGLPVRRQRPARRRRGLTWSEGPGRDAAHDQGQRRSAPGHRHSRHRGHHPRPSRWQDRPRHEPKPIPPASTTRSGSSPSRSAWPVRSVPGCIRPSRARWPSWPRWCPA